MAEPDRVDEEPVPADAADDQCPDLSDPRSPRILQYALEGYTWDQIARELKIHVRTLLRIRQRDRLDELLDQITVDDGKATIRAYLTMRRKAFITTARLMDSPDVRTQLAAIRQAFGFVVAKEGPGALIDGDLSPPAPNALAAPEPPRPERTLAEKAARAEYLRRVKLGSGGSQTGGSRR